MRERGARKGRKGSAPLHVDDCVMLGIRDADQQRALVPVQRSRRTLLSSTVGHVDFRDCGGGFILLREIRPQAVAHLQNLRRVGPYLERKTHREEGGPEG